MGCSAGMVFYQADVKKSDTANGCNPCVYPRHKPNNKNVVVVGICACYS